MKKYILIITVLFLAGGLLRGETVGGDTRLNEKLFKAVSGGDTGLAALLLRKGADINAKDRFGWSPLHIAVYSGKVTVIHYLVSKKADLYSKTGKEKNIPVHERTRKVPKGAIPLHLAKRGFISMGSIQEVRECLYPFYKRKDFDAYIIEENLTDTFRRKKIRAYLKNTKSVNSFIDEYARSMGMLQQKVYSRTRLLRTFGHCQAYATDVKFEDVYPMLIATFISLLRHSQKIINIPYLRIDRSKKNPENRDLIMKINSFRAENTVSNRTINALFFDTDFIPGIVSSCIDNPFLMLEKDSHGIKSLEIDNNKITIEGPVPSKTPEILKREIESGYKNKTAHISLRRKKDRFVLQFTYKSAVREFYTKSLNLSIDQRLLNAIRDRDPYLVKIYVQEGADINYQDEFGWTALHAAVYAGDIPLIQYLVKQNVRKYSRTTEDRVVRIPGREEIVKKGSRPLDLAQKGIIAQGLPEKVRASVYAYYKKEDLENYDIKKIIEQELREKDGIDIDKKKNELNLLLKNHKPVEQYIDEHAQSLGIKKNKVYYRNKTKDIHSWKLKKETVIAKFRSLDYKTIIQFITLVENTKKLINVSYVRINRDYRDPRVYGLTMKIQGFSTEQTLPREAVRSFIFDTGFIPGFLQYVKTGFSGDDYFLLKQLVLNERTIRADGSSSSSENIEAFINKLKKDYKDKIEDVSLNIRSTRQKNIRFFLTIRWKRSGPELAR